ncbi:hypothetical protein NE237_017229 [Protea cynaroides]|uniref:Uncharacterized protein n=1 Tax=Protea cynaroides TaxID=273540 RepID=A0A9Q0QMM2_9MAGN|nr:hypothetical protein NE237_017229 [Protea cynaroides]
MLGNVKIKEGAKNGAGAVVLIDVPPRTTAMGNPARLVGGKEKPSKLEDVMGNPWIIHQEKGIEIDRRCFIREKTRSPNCFRRAIKSPKVRTSLTAFAAIIPRIESRNTLVCL